jgi:predicted dehydrogenase
MPLDRRAFLDRASQAGVAAGAAALAAGSSRAAVAAGDKLRLAMIGIRGRGIYLAQGFLERPDCEIAYLCDVDASLFESRVKQIADLQGHAPQTVQDFRRALDDPAVDAVVIATPDHWHALATVWACQQGKDVYVEKPVSHSPWEGRQMVAAGRKHQRVVQAGLQNRSAPYNQAAKEYIASGKLGRIHMCRVYNQKLWANQAPAPLADVPAGLDWDMWTGPAPESRYTTNYHNGWNHFWRFSGGDIINDAVHQMDLARWLIGKDYPRNVYCVGSRYNEQGAFETPDTQVAVYEFDDLVMTFELTLYTPYMIKSDMELRNSDLYPYWPQNGTRVEIYGDQGLMIAGRHGDGWQVFDKQYRREPQIVAQGNGNFPDPEHKQNFVEAIRSRSTPSADILEGHRSALLCQYANISLRLGGRKLTIDPATEAFVGDDEANAMLKREYRAPWVVPEIA